MKLKKQAARKSAILRPGTHGTHVNARKRDKIFETAEAKASGLLCVAFIVHFNKAHAVFNMAQSACAVDTESL